MIKGIKKWIIHHLLFRLLDKQKIYNVFEFIYLTNYWGSDESRSGIGSEEQATIHIRNEINEIIEHYSVQSVLDLPCGDVNWISPEKISAKYIGGDIVKKIILRNIKKYNGKIQFKVLDITKSELPPADLILCRECLQHLSYKNIKLAIENIKNAKIKYLLVTTYPNGKNKDIENGHFFEINLEQEPFNLKGPLKKIEEVESNKLQSRKNKQYLYLYDISKILGNKS